MSVIDWLLDPNYWDIPIVVVILALLGTYLTISGKKNKLLAEAQQRAEDMELLRKAEAGDEEATRGTFRVNWAYYGYEVMGRAQAVAERREAELDWKKSGLPLLQSMNWLEQADTATRISRLEQFVHSYSYLRGTTRERLAAESGFTFEQTKTILQKMVTGYVRHLSQNLNDKQSFTDLHVIVLECRRKDSFLHQFTHGIDYPEGWEEVMVDHFPRPRTEYFHKHDEPKSGEIAEWAEVALKAGDIVRLKLVLAYANQSGRLRADLTEHYYVEVIKAVTEYNQANVQVSWQGKLAQ